MDGLAFSTSLKGGYLNDGSDYDRNRIVHTFYASQPCPIQHNLGPCLAPPKYYEFFHIVEHALCLVDFKSSTIPFLFLGTLIQQS